MLFLHTGLFYILELFPIRSFGAPHFCCSRELSSSALQIIEKSSLSLRLYFFHEMKNYNAINSKSKKNKRKKVEEKGIKFENNFDIINGYIDFYFNAYPE